MNYTFYVHCVPHGGVQATASWVIAELVRIFHDTTTKEA
jgi:hypothetical protein